MAITDATAPWLPNRERLQELYIAYEEAFKTVLSRLEETLKSTIVISSVPTYKSRIKSFTSYYRKLLRILPEGIESNHDLPVLTDIIGIRVICPFLQDLTEVERRLHESFDVYEVERKGADRTFREFGYESTHVLLAIPKDLKKGLKLPEGLIFEIQVRTILQDAWAEVEHELVYKSEFSPFDLPLKRKLASINASLSLADIIFQEIRDYQNKLNRELDQRRGQFYQKADTESDKNIFAAVSGSGLVENDSEESHLYDPGTIDDLILNAIEAHNKGDLTRAIRIYSKIIDAEPNDTVLSVMFKHRGMAYFAQSKYQEALRDFELSADKKPDNFRSYYYIGIVQCVLGNDEDAIQQFSKSLELNLFQPYVYFRRAQSYFHQSLFSEALQDLDRAVSLGFNKEEERVLRMMIAKKIDI